MKIKQKILLVFIGLASLVGVIGYSAIKSLKEISSEAIRIRESSVLELKHASEMAFEFTKIDFLVDEYVYETIENNPIEIAIVKNKLEESFKAFEKAMASTRSITAAGLKLYEGTDLNEEKEELIKIENLEKKHLNYKKDLRVKIAGYKKHGQEYKPAENRWKEKDLLKEVQLIRTDARNEIILETTEMMEEAEDSTNFLIFLGGLSFILAVMASLFITKSIVSPILKLKKAAKSIADGNMVLIKDINTGDEIGDLAVSFNMMTTDLIKSRTQLEEYNTALEQKVNEKTQELAEALGIVH